MNIPPHSFEATPEQLESHIEFYVDSFISGLQSFFMVMPKGGDFVDYERFQRAYGVLRESTKNFDEFSEGQVLKAIESDPLALVVVRTILGLSPPEFGHIASLAVGVDVDQSSARRIDKRAREGKPLLLGTAPKTRQQVGALVRAAIHLIREGAPATGVEVVHRLDKIDTGAGLEGLRRVAGAGLPYEALLYERLLGRPFASHRDAVSERVGDILERAVGRGLDSRRVPFHKAGVAEKFEDMDQAPDFLVPDPRQPKVVIEAKLAEDDGTARDKVTRIQHLSELRDQRLRQGRPSFDVVACVDGRGFGIRREDVKKLLVATQGKLFSLQTVDRMIDSTALGGMQR
ncbi:MAG: hypothetical protein HY684_06760 [Chloroflexi bacterium]|nr:hypothetical protein [Chloroflexota bacterium]